MPRKILIADDDVVHRKHVKHLLEKHSDFKVIAEAGDGEETVKLAFERNPDVVLMDLDMPRLNGMEATRRLKAVHSEMKVLLLVSGEGETYRQAADWCGADGCLLRYSGASQMLAAIRGVLVQSMS